MEKSKVAAAYHLTVNDPPKPFDLLPDVRDGLNSKERLVVYCLMQTQKEFNDHNVLTITLYGRVLEHIDLDHTEFQHILAKITELTRNLNDFTRS